jgi:hypothetical protein
MGHGVAVAAQLAHVLNSLRALRKVEAANYNSYLWAQPASRDENVAHTAGLSSAACYSPILFSGE